MKSATNYFSTSLTRAVSWIQHQHSQKKTPWLFLRGDLGAGKTTFTRELLEALQFDASEVQSPTFLKVLTYSSATRVCVHMDAYRISDSDEFIKLGLEVYEGLSLGIVEWPQIFEDFLITHPHYCDVLDINDVLEITFSSDRDEAKLQFVTRRISLK